MPLEQIFVIIVILTTLVGLLVYFNSANKKLALQHLQRSELIEGDLRLHSLQINMRSNSLNNYNFNTYNLEAILKPQFEIKI